MHVAAKQADVIQVGWVSVPVDFKIHQTETKFARNGYMGEYIMRLPLSARNRSGAVSWRLVGLTAFKIFRGRLLGRVRPFFMSGFRAEAPHPHPRPLLGGEGR